MFHRISYSVNKYKLVIIESDAFLKIIIVLPHSQSQIEGQC